MLWRTALLWLLGALLGITANLIGPEPIPWIRGGDGGDAPPEAGGGVDGDLSLHAMRIFSETGLAYIVDARRREDFCLGHIPNAFSLDVRQFQQRFAEFRESWLNSGRLPIIVYCTGGECEDSHNLIEELKIQGITRTMIYAGGWEQWSTAGMPVEKCE